MTNLPQEGSAYYERHDVREEYLAFHYPDPTGDPLRALLGERTPPLDQRFPFGLQGLWREARGGATGGRALDVGCAVGAMTLLLAEDHDEAIGVDLSQALIDGAKSVQRAGRARYRLVDEGKIETLVDVPVASRANAKFFVGDALSLAFADSQFDTVIALNLIDRVPDARAALGELKRVTALSGVLIVASPYTWLPSFSPPERWLGGFFRDGHPVRGKDTVQALLDPEFSLYQERRMPFFIPHHARSGQLAVAIVQCYRRTS
ncbi:MAG: methyltransferase domain-containing protein [Planctomycetota bacterium]|jgi:SAM-dependent methyltransferase